MTFKKVNLPESLLKFSSSFITENPSSSFGLGTIIGQYTRI